MIEIVRRGRVAQLTLNRPPVNAISDEMILAFHHVLDELETQGDWSVLHIRSAHKVFAAGADLDLIKSWRDAATPAYTFAAYIDRLQRLYLRLDNLRQLTFCEIGGAAMGGGLELALSCDLRMAADDAKLGFPEVLIGLIPAAGGTQRLTRLCGRGTASRLIFGGDPVDGRTAATLGIVQWAVPRSDLEDAARATVERLAAQPGSALLAAKQCIVAATDDRGHGYRMERDLAGELLEEKDTQALIAAFLERTAKSARSS